MHLLLTIKLLHAETIEKATGLGLCWWVVCNSKLSITCSHKFLSTDCPQLSLLLEQNWPISIDQSSMVLYFDLCTFCFFYLREHQLKIVIDWQRKLRFIHKIVIVLFSDFFLRFFFIQKNIESSSFLQCEINEPKLSIRKIFFIHPKI